MEGWLTQHAMTIRWVGLRRNLQWLALPRHKADVDVNVFLSWCLVKKVRAGRSDDSPSAMSTAECHHLQRTPRCGLCALREHQSMIAETST